MNLPTKPNEINMDKISLCLERLSLSDKDYVNEVQMMEMISKLNGGLFDRNIFQEIWDQCKINSKGEVKVAEFMEYILRAEEILV